MTFAVFEIIPLSGEPHARFDATSRTYDYFIHTYKDPFLHNISSYYAEKELDWKRCGPQYPCCYDTTIMLRFAGILRTASFPGRALFQHSRSLCCEEKGLYKCG